MTPLPLTDMGTDDRYKGQDGGLYGGGRNSPPPGHLEAAMQAAANIRPLAPDGTDSDSGLIGLLSIGFSHTAEEFREFIRVSRDDSAISPLVRPVNGAQPHMGTHAWATARSPWRVVADRLAKADLGAPQVQAVWIKTAPSNPAHLGEFPIHADSMKRDLHEVVTKLASRFPNLRLAYLSSRSYGGYATTGLSPEPYAFEGAFAMRSLIQDQIRGDPALNWDPLSGPRGAPLLLWGPYLWADGTNRRQLDDLTWEREDFEADGTHTTPSGSGKIAQLLLGFFKTDPTARPWFLRPGPGGKHQS